MTVNQDKNLIKVADWIPSRSKAAYIKAKYLFVDGNDLSKDRQRNPEDRRKKLISKYGEKGELFSIEKAGALLVKQRENINGGPIPYFYALKDGGGRWWSVMNLLKKPEQELLCVIMDATGDLEAFTGANDCLVIPKGKIFMSMGSDPKNKYEYEICQTVKALGYTFAPANGIKSIGVNAGVFAYELDVLEESLQLCRDYFVKDPTSKNSRIESMALTGVAGFLYTYAGHYDKSRLRAVLAKSNYEEIKAGARKLMPDNKEHGRQYAPAIAEKVANMYNFKLAESNKLKIREIERLVEDVQGHSKYQYFSDVWQMPKSVKESKKK